MWTKFNDMHSGGGSKLDWEEIFIEAPEDDACIIFQNMFGRNPCTVTCTCCGADYFVLEYDTLEEALESSWNKGGIHKLVYADEIKAEDRKGYLQEEGYGWR